MISFTADFIDTKTDLPIVSDVFTIPVFFICGETLHKGEYHRNGCFYAINGVVATRDGKVVRSMFHPEGDGFSDCAICTHWCYIDDLKMITQ